MPAAESLINGTPSLATCRKDVQTNPVGPKNSSAVSESRLSLLVG